VNEGFSFLLKRKSAKKFKFCGFGENDEMGTFKLEGNCDLLNLDK